MHRVFSISLLLLFLTDTVGGTLLLLLHRSQLRKEMREWISKLTDREILVKQLMSPEEYAGLQWIEYGHEYLHEDKMYDVESIQYQPDGRILVYSIHDVKESKLKDQIKQQFASDSTDNPKHQHFILTFFEFLSQLIPQTIQVIYVSNEYLFQPTDFYLNTYRSIVQPHLFQPPEVFPFHS